MVSSKGIRCIFCLQQGLNFKFTSPYCWMLYSKCWGIAVNGEWSICGNIQSRISRKFPSSMHCNILNQGHLKKYYQNKPFFQCQHHIVNPPFWMIGSRVSGLITWSLDGWFLAANSMRLNRSQPFPNTPKPFLTPVLVNVGRRYMQVYLDFYLVPDPFSSHKFKM